MTEILKTIHVIAAILVIGPIAVAASMFPRYARQGFAHPDDPAGKTAADLLHRICQVYSAIGLFVPAFGFATASSLGVLGDGWLLASIGVTTIAALILLLWLIPAQGEIVSQLAAIASGDVSPPPEEIKSKISRLAMGSGLFNLLWVIVVILMVTRPGSSIG